MLLKCGSRKIVESTSTHIILNLCVPSLSELLGKPPCEQKKLLSGKFLNGCLNFFNSTNCLENIMKKRSGKGGAFLVLGSWFLVLGSWFGNEEL